MATLGLASTARAAPKHPNIVFILTHDMMLADVVVMPATRRLIGRGGVTFTNAFIDVSLCCPSRATILTGRYAQNTKVHQNQGPNRGYAAFRKMVFWHRTSRRRALVGTLRFLSTRRCRARLPSSRPTSPTSRRPTGRSRH